MVSKPYQPFLFRFLHGLTSICLLLAIVSAFWTYNVYDGRWGRLPLPDYPAIEGIHGTFGLYTLLIFPAFVRYAFAKGRQRLVQSDSVAAIAQVNKPIWWYTLNRFANTLVLVALTFAVFSGKMMDSTWLPSGELDHRWYAVHLSAWVVMVVAIALHVLLNARVGGLPLLRSMWHRNIRPDDSPRLWKAQVVAWWSATQQLSWLTRVRTVVSLSRLELVIESLLIAAWLISLFKEFAL